jgi:hypothetical protein
MATKKESGSNTPTWTYEWVPIDSIIKHSAWQVRDKLDPRAVKRYQDMTNAGSAPPPIKVGRVNGRLYLLDGWHRMEAGAFKSSSAGEVLAEVADLTQADAMWEAAKANLGHGVQYKPKDLHAVFKAFIKSKKYIKSNGKPMSYREMSPIIGKGHTTIRSWMLKYFPKLARELGGLDHGNQEATTPPAPQLAGEHHLAAFEALQTITQRFDLITPEARWVILRRLETLQEKAAELGVKEPPKPDF